MGVSRVVGRMNNPTLSASRPLSTRPWDLERCAVPECPWFAGQHRHVVPRIEDGLVTAEDPAMLADSAAVLAEFDAVGPDRELGARISTGLPTALALTEYLLVSKRTRRVLETVAGTA